MSPGAATRNCGGHVLPGRPLGLLALEAVDRQPVEVAEAVPLGVGDDEVEHGPAEGDAASLSGHAPDHIGTPAHLVE